MTESPAGGPATKAVSSWSLHRTLGSFRAGATDSPPATGMPLLELPAELSRRGFDTFQLCHFHLPSRDPSYLAELRSALDTSSITLDALLVDDGDLTDPDDADRHQAWIGDWLDDAVALGAHRARVIAGKNAPTAETLGESARRLRALAAAHPDVRVVTENWFDLLPDAAAVLSLFEQTAGDVGFLIDLGNWTGSEKYGELAAVAHLAETCHAKCRFDATGPDTTDYAAALQVLRDAEFDGPLALIYDGPDADEWSALEQEHAVVQTVFTS
ncbi:MAG: TIM barrel protein [Propionibacteriaceae bacterium]